MIRKRLPSEAMSYFVRADDWAPHEVGIKQRHGNAEFDGRLFVIEPFDAVESENIDMGLFIDPHFDLPSSPELV